MYDKYLIKEGETLEDIASRFNTSVDMILNINDMYSREYLRAGEEIIVPKNQESYFTYYTVNQGDSLYQIARKYNINPSLLALLNGLNMEDYIYPNQRLIIPKSGYSFYITKDGDTLEIVRDKFNKNWEDILKYNETIYLLPGQLMINKNN
ncbi:MAG: LysM peptidoglycan-binding domain-containing protein [Bacilli bacterium]